MVDPLTSLNPINHLKMLYLKKERHFASLFFSLRFSFSLLPSSLTRVFEMSTAWMVEIEKVIHNVFARFDWLLVSSTKWVKNGEYGSSFYRACGSWNFL